MYWSYLGVFEYLKACQLQERLRDLIGNGAWPETLLLLQHPRVITLGRSAKLEHVLVSEQERQERGIALVASTRGGDVTYHGPGQLVGYPVRRVGRQIKEHVLAMVESIIAFLGCYSIEAWWEESKPGVWCADGKIAAVGVDARGGVAIHGFALNIDPVLQDYDMIVPCGLQAKVATMKGLPPRHDLPSIEEAAHWIACDLIQRYGSVPEKISAQQLMELSLCQQC